MRANVPDGFVPDAPLGPGVPERATKAVADFIAPPTGGPTVFQRAADAIVPTDPSKPTIPGRIVDDLKTPTGAGGAIGTLLPTILSAVPQTRAFGMAANTPVGRTISGGFGSAVGALMEGKDPLSEGAQTAGWNALGEGVMGGGGKIIRSLPNVKGRIVESQARGMVDAIRSVSPELANAVEANRGAVAPTLRGPKTSAALQETALGPSGGDALSGAFERGMTQIDKLAPNATVMGPSLLDAYSAMPQLARDRLIGTVAPGGFTPRQAQEVLSWLGSDAFNAAPLGQGVGPVPKQKMWADALKETVGGLHAASPDAANVFTQIRPPYAGGQQYLEMLRQPGAFSSYGNRLNMNENAIRNYSSSNRMDLAEKLGPDGYAALMKVLGNAQPGTRSIMAPGGGGATDALAQVYGRGQGGAPQLIGSPLRTLLPNIGYEAAGRAPYTLPPAVQAIIDAGLQRAGGAAISGERR